MSDIGTKGDLVTQQGRIPGHRRVTLTQLPGSASLTKSGMTFPQELPQRAWEQIGNQLRELASSSSWWLGDWLVFGETSYSGRYREAVKRTGLDYQTLRNYAWVARRFEQHRRRDTLSFAHHAEVARLKSPEQDYWLRRAEEQQWSRNELRKQVRASLAEQRGDAVAELTGPEPAPLPEPVAAQAPAPAVAFVPVLEAGPAPVFVPVLEPGPTPLRAPAPAGGRGLLPRQRPVPWPGTDSRPGSADGEAAGTAGAIQIALSQQELDRLLAAAASSGLSLNDWAAHVLQSALDAQPVHATAPAAGVR